MIDVDQVGDASAVDTNVRGVENVRPTRCGMVLGIDLGKGARTARVRRAVGPDHARPRPVTLCGVVGGKDEDDVGAATYDLAHRVLDDARADDDTSGRRRGPSVRKAGGN